MHIETSTIHKVHYYSTWFDFEALGRKRQTVHVFNQFRIARVHATKEGISQNKNAILINYLTALN